MYEAKEKILRFSSYTCLFSILKSDRTYGKVIGRARVPTTTVNAYIVYINSQVPQPFGNFLLFTQNIQLSYSKYQIEWV